MGVVQRFLLFISLCYGTNYFTPGKPPSPVVGEMASPQCQKAATTFPYQPRPTTAEIERSRSFSAVVGFPWGGGLAAAPTIDEIERSRSFSVVLGFLWLPLRPPSIIVPTTARIEHSRSFLAVVGFL